MKLVDVAGLQDVHQSPPSRGARIETCLGAVCWGRVVSPPSRGARIETVNRELIML